MARLASDSLLWIKAELDNTLLRARQALEAFVEDHDEQLLNECLTHLHQVHGTLRIVEVHGAAQLAAEMEATAQDVKDKKIKGDEQDAFEVLMRAMLQLPDYLERVISGQREMPLLLLSLLNDLRAVRGESLLSESSLFAQNLAQRGAAAQFTVSGGGDIVALAKKLRPKFQAALLGWFKSGGAAELKQLADTAAQLEQAASTPGAYQLWWIVGGVLEGLLDNSIEASVSLKQLLGQVDRQIKRLLDNGEAALNDDPPTELVNNLLYYIGTSASTGERTAAIKESFQLADLLTAEDQSAAGMVGPNEALMRTVSAAIKDDIAQIKDALDIFVRTAKTDAEELAPSAELLKKVGDTLGVLSLDDARTSIESEHKRLQGMLAGKQPITEAVLMDIAAALIKVETTLDNQLLNLTRHGRLSHAALEAAEQTVTGLRVEETDFIEVSGAVIRESIINLARVKDSIVEYIKNPAQPEVLRPVPPLVQQIRAGLSMLELNRPSQSLSSVLAYIKHRILDQAAVPPQHELDRMADAIVSIEFYLETVQEGRGNPEAMLDNADACTQALGFPVGADYDAELAAAEDEAPPSLEGVEVEETPMPVVEAAPVPASKPAVAVRPEDIDPEIVEIFLEESQEELASLREHFPRWKNTPDNNDALTTVRRSFHTLKGSGRMVGAEQIGEFAWSVENMLNRVIDRTIETDDELFALVEHAIATLPELIEQLEIGTEPKTDVQHIMACAHALAKGETLPQGAVSAEAAATPVIESAPQPVAASAAPESVTKPAPEITAAAGAVMDPVLYDIFNREAQGHVLVLEEFTATGSAAASEELVRALHTLHGSASMAGVEQIALLTAPLERYVRQAQENSQPLSAEGRQLVQDAAGAIRQVLEALPDSSVTTLDLDGFATRCEAARAALAPAPLVETLASAGKAAAPQRTVEIGELENFDAELAGIFLEEANELLEAIDGALQEWSKDRNDPGYVAELQRHLHTLKGGARMAGITPMGDLSHEMESVFTRVVDGHLPVSGEMFAVVQRSVDRLHRMLEQVYAREAIVDGGDLIRDMRILLGGVESQLAEAFGPTAAQPAAPALSTADEASFTVAEEAGRAGERRSGARIQHELVRVRGDLIESLLNAAGEVSIYRSRLNQQLSTMTFNLTEMDNTVARLRDQLRKLEIETEAQILFQFEKETGEDAAHSDFDPLELDRYSLLQQLSRGLAETVSDLLSIQQLLVQQAREAETLLLQQSRVNTDMQDGLMRTRMVPFSNQAQRLRRLVRQTADDVGKQAELKLVGAEGEMDRQILERVMGPLEHMMRNAVIHGIETPAERKKAGKPEQGSISIHLYREASEVVMQISDDGAGLNVAAIRKKAESLGLMRKGAKISDDDVVQFIVEAGFSTAETVTQAAGRGVGMDVVASEIKQLGGGLRIRNTPGKGAHFTVRLPFTLAISQALMITVAEEPYAIPLPAIEGIVRIPRADLLRYMQEENPVFSYGGREFSLQYLGVLLGLGIPQLPEELETVPVLLVRAGEHSSALVTEGMQGSREIVVKSVGPQISNIRGISGATLMGDGSIVVILDPAGLVRAVAAAAAQGTALEAAQRVAEEDATEAQTFAMVVDDSITVRRVTQRLLERYGMRVITAKDGVDALALLQEHMPDVMLLDIEMPRMDGYELATNMRNDARTREIPIIMITSRTGEKHRTRAMEIGVNSYLGKPFQESELLEEIAKLVGKFNPERTRWE